MNKVTKLTPKQEMQIPVYLDKWIKNGLRTDEIPFETAVSEAKWLYSAFLKDHSPEPIVFLARSPFEALVMAKTIKHLTKSNEQTQLDSQLSSRLDSQLYSQLYSRLDSQLYSRLDSQLRSQLDSQLYSQLDSQLYSQLSSQLSSRLDSQLSSEKIEPLSYRSDAWYWAGYYGFYDFVLEVILPKQRKDFALFKRYREHLERVNWLVPLKGLCIVVQRPTEIHFNAHDSNGLRGLHKEGGLAVKYADGWGVHALNGIRVPAWATETPVDKFTKKQVMSEKNADVRREVIRRMGPERLIKVLNYKVLDSFEGYELIAFDIGDKIVRPWLKMKNPSMNLTHIEGVRPEITTVKEALCYRNSLDTYAPPLSLS